MMIFEKEEVIRGDYNNLFVLTSIILDNSSSLRGGYGIS
jgi:hypothetical protein